ncbi:MAG: hypothetical protein IJU37_01585 [Desulfovibrio sp.]|nr:hypothetical protein [Desulfovibrio sp.]
MNISELGYSSSTLAYLWQNQGLQTTATSDTSSRSGLTSQTLRNAYGNSSDMSSKLSSMVELTKYVMDAMGLDSDARVTFNQINKYREQLTTAFNTAVKEGLGTSADTAFTLKVDDITGDVIVESSDAEFKTAAQTFFDNNPEVVKQFKQLEALSGLDDARRAMQISPSDMRRRIEIESLAAWWAGSSNSTASFFGNYTNDSLSILSGLNLNV